MAAPAAPTPALPTAFPNSSALLALANIGGKNLLDASAAVLTPVGALEAAPAKTLPPIAPAPLVAKLNTAPPAAAAAN
jgi:hypothetical protein